ncbi:MAG: S8 family serine peptidase [Candidatus Cloacimonetes bacterium]|nr:S8 family serine peptidase [Candidatus Cloacimonadota bacterium]
MKKFLPGLVFLLTINTLLLGNSFRYTPTEMIVKTTEPKGNSRINTLDVPEFDSFLVQKDVKQIKAITPSLENRFYVIRFEEPLDWEELKIQDPRFDGIEYIQPNYLNEFHVVPNDPLFTQQALHLSRIPEAWHYEIGNHNVIVAIVDSGLWFEHPEFSTYENIWINEAEYPPNGEDSSGNGYIDDWRGWDFVDAPELAQIALGDYLDQDNDPTDESGHGTHIAGIIGAATNNDQGIAGICWNVSMMILRAGFRTTIGAGYLQDDDAAAAIIYAVDNGAHVINLSWGSTIFSQIIADACQYAYDNGVIVVASAGNTPVPEVMYPARLNTTISVGAVNNFLNLTGFTSFGPDLDIVAPGEFILSTYIPIANSIYYNSSGTSMSAPFVVGAIALLLSREPGLSFNEVKSRLFSSAIDLGTPGFDNYFGHGLLNVEGLLTITDVPYIEVTSPDDHSGLSGSFDITGSVSASDFFRYTVMYTNAEMPTTLDWKDVVTHQNTPSFYYNEVHDDLIAHFYVPPTLPDDNYLIRVKLETITAGIYEKRFRVNVNQSTPVLKEGYPIAIRRYHADIPYYFVTTEFDQHVSLQMAVHSNTGYSTNVFSNYADSLHILQLPVDLPEGNISLQFTATNVSGLEYTTPLFENVIYLDKTGIPTDTFIQQTVGPAIITTPKSFDINDNGFREFIGMSIGEGQVLGDLKIYEFSYEEMIEKFTYNDSFLPIDMGIENNFGLEVLGLIGNTAVLYGTLDETEYPSFDFWTSGNTMGGNIIDYNNNGIDDLILVQNFQNTRVLTLYRRSSNHLQFVQENTLFNTTETFERNTFAPRVAARDLNGNGFMNILAADTDGDVMVYEIYNAVSDSLIWHTRLPARNLYHVSIGDYTGNGQPEFCVGGFESDLVDPNKTYWYFEFFRYDTAFQDFITLGYLSFDHYDDVNSINALDLTGDGNLELVFALTPYLYIIDYIDGEFVPIYRGSTHRTYNVIPIPQHEDYPAGVIINNSDGVDSKSQFVTLNNFTGPPSPIGLTTQPVDEHTVKLDWNYCAAEYYLIYRKHDDLITLVDSTYSNTYTDNNLIEGEEYYYSLRSVHHGYDPYISQHTTWSLAIPYAIPELLSIRMTQVNELRLLFDVQLSNDAINLGYYNVNNGVGRPSSVNHTENQRGLLLRFLNSLSEPEEDYYIEITGLTGRSGVPFPHGQYYFIYTEDLEAPVVLSHRVVNDQMLEIVFSKDLDADIVQDEANFTLQTPLVDAQNRINNIHCYDNYLEIYFREKLKHSNRPYYLTMNNIVDLAGNSLPNNQNIIRFQLTDMTTLKHVQIAPNPFNRNVHSRLEFIGLPINQQGEIRIYSLSGETVYSSTISPLTELNSSYHWSGVNNENRALSSGIYIYIIRMGKEQKRGQIAIVN